MLIKRFHIDLSRVCVSSCDEFGHMSSLIRVSSHVRTDAEDIIHFAESGSAGPWRDDTAGVRHRQQYVRSAVQLPAGACANAAPGTGYVLIYDSNVLVHHIHLHNSCRLRDSYFEDYKGFLYVTMRSDVHCIIFVVVNAKRNLRHFTCKHFVMYSVHFVELHVPT